MMSQISSIIKLQFFTFIFLRDLCAKKGKQKFLGGRIVARSRTETYTYDTRGNMASGMNLPVLPDVSEAHREVSI